MGVPSLLKGGAPKSSSSWWIGVLTFDAVPAAFGPSSDRSGNKKGRGEIAPTFPFAFPSLPVTSVVRASRRDVASGTVSSAHQRCLWRISIGARCRCRGDRPSTFRFCCRRSIDFVELLATRSSSMVGIHHPRSRSYSPGSTLASHVWTSSSRVGARHPAQTCSTSMFGWCSETSWALTSSPVISVTR